MENAEILPDWLKLCSSGGSVSYTYLPNYSAKDLAKELKTNTRYLSAVVNSRFGMNYSRLLNEYRIKEMCIRDRW